MMLIVKIRTLHVWAVDSDWLHCIQSDFFWRTVLRGDSIHFKLHFLLFLLREHAFISVIYCGVLQQK